MKKLLIILLSVPTLAFAGPRKVVQLVYIVAVGNNPAQVIAVCDDGTLWSAGANVIADPNPNWQQIKGPQ